MPDARPGVGDPARVAAIDAALPQTQCRRCGFDDCRAYAEALVGGSAPIDRCPPGGAEGIARLAALTRQPSRPLDPAHGREVPRGVARIDETRCIGCTLCIQACPVDCIVGAPKLMHGVIEGLCTGCELCLPACPVDCIEFPLVSGAATGWAAWSPARAAEARERYRRHRRRLERDADDERRRLERVAAPPDATADDGATARRALVEAALRRRSAPPAR